MQVRVTFLVGWLTAYFWKGTSPAPELLRVETQLLREEIQAARLAVDSLSEFR